MIDISNNPDITANGLSLFFDKICNMRNLQALNCSWLQYNNDTLIRMKMMLATNSIVDLRLNGIVSCSSTLVMRDLEKYKVLCKCK